MLFTQDMLPLFAPSPALAVSGSKAPEHQHIDGAFLTPADVFVPYDDFYRAQFVDGFQIHHLFDAPAREDIVRLGKKSAGCYLPVEQAQARIAGWKAHTNAQSKGRNGQKVVLSFFDYTGEWSKPWEKAGYNVFRFDIQHCAEMGDVMAFSTDFFSDWFGDFDGMEIYAILAAIPCTDFASSGSRHFAAKDVDGRTAASIRLVHKTLAAIEYFKPTIWAAENPVGRIGNLGGLPPWRLTFDPCDLGDTYTKKTNIWGRFNADLPIAPVFPAEGSKMHKRYGGKSLQTKNARSVTPEGFAYAFFMANNAIDNPTLALRGKYDRLDRDLLRRVVRAEIDAETISEIIDDFYYIELNDQAAEQALRSVLH